MTIEKIVSYIEKPNLVSELTKAQLAVIADDVISRAEQDKDSMKDWFDCVKKGIDLCRPENSSKDDPWPGAANFKSTMLTEASNTFGNRASIEIMRDIELVKTSVIGATTRKNVIDKKASMNSQLKTQLDPINDQIQQIKAAGQDTSQLDAAAKQIQDQIDANDKLIQAKRLEYRQENERADRVSELMNWQINFDMCEWRDDQIRLMYSLPNEGSKFKEMFYDDTLGRCVSKVISYPDFYINQKTTDLLTCRSFTHICAFSRSEFEIRKSLGIWDGDIYADKAQGDAGSDEQETAKTTEENSEKFYKQYCWLDLDDDNIEEPYIVVVHVASSTVVRIVARYSLDTILVRSGSGRPMPLIAAQHKNVAQADKDSQEFGTKPNYPDPKDLSIFNLVRVEARPILTKYGLIPSPEGDFLDVGFYYMIGSLAMGNNKLTNSLLNSASLSNMQGGFVSKDFRKKPGQFTVKQGEFTSTELSSAAMTGAIIPFPYKEPSNVLAMLNEKIDNQGRSFSANSDLGIQSNTAPTTALAMIQEAQTPHTAHMSSIISSMGNEFKILFTLNRDYFDADEYVKIVGDEEAVFNDDFNTDGLNISCGANAEMSSRMQRMMLAEAEMAQFDRVVQAGGNASKLVKNYFSRIGSENTDEYFPNEAEMSPEDKQQVQAMQQQQKAANDMQQQQTMLLQTQTEILKRGEDRKDAQFQVDKAETASKLATEQESREQMKAEILLTMEQALTEKVKNGLAITSAVSAEMDKAYQMTKDSDDIQNQILAAQPQATPNE